MIRRDMLRLLASAAWAGNAVHEFGTAADELFAGFCLGFPLFEFARTAYASTAPRSCGGAWLFNTPLSRRQLSDPSNRQITAINNDCLVTNARIDLSGGPVVVEIPDIEGRYFSAAFMDAFTDNFFFVGTRPTAGRGGRFALVPPGWSRASVPAGAQPVLSPTLDVWMLVRILIDGPEDAAAVHALQDRIYIEPPKGWQGGAILSVEPGDVTDARNFLVVVRDMHSRCDAADPRVARASEHADFQSKRPDEIAMRWTGAIAEGLARLRLAPLDGRDADGWSYSLASTGAFGTNDEMRARIALLGLAALPPEEAFYAHALADREGRVLVGQGSYRLRLPAGEIPVDAFWSLTMYSIDPDGRLYLVPNPGARYSIGDRSRHLIKNPDGTLDIFLQRRAPEGPLSANWLPTPEGPFRPLFRGYLAQRRFRELQWRLPPIERID